MISRTKKELDDILKLEEEIWEQKRRQKTMSFSIKKAFHRSSTNKMKNMNNDMESCVMMRKVFKRCYPLFLRSLPILHSFKSGHKNL